MLDVEILNAPATAVVPLTPRDAVQEVSKHQQVFDVD